jgi:hypothetical protein
MCLSQACGCTWGNTARSMLLPVITATHVIRRAHYTHIGSALVEAAAHKGRE